MVHRNPVFSEDEVDVGIVLGDAWSGDGDDDVGCGGGGGCELQVHVLGVLVPHHLDHYEYSRSVLDASGLRRTATVHVGSSYSNSVFRDSMRHVVRAYDGHVEATRTAD